MVHPLKHIHERKIVPRLHAHPYPASSPLIRFVDWFIIFLGFTSPLFSIPQMYGIWIQHNAAGVSALSWGGYTFATAVWLVYGILHREKPIIVSQIIGLCVNLIVTIGAIIY